MVVGRSWACQCDNALKEALAAGCSFELLSDGGLRGPSVEGHRSCYRSTAWLCYAVPQRSVVCHDGCVSHGCQFSLSRREDCIGDAHKPYNNRGALMISWELRHDESRQGVKTVANKNKNIFFLWK